MLTPDLDYSKDLRTLRKLEPVSIQWKDCIRIMTKGRDLTLKEQVISTLKKQTGKGNRKNMQVKEARYRADCTVCSRGLCNREQIL